MSPPGGYAKRRTYVHIDAPNMLRHGQKQLIEFEDINWLDLYSKVVEPETFLRTHIYTPGKYKKKYQAAAASCGLPKPTLFFSPYSNWKADVDAVLVSFLVGSTLRSLDKLPCDGNLHVIVFSGDSDFINAYKMLKEIARSKNKHLRITVAAWKGNLPLNRKTLHEYVDEVVELTNLPS